VAVAIPFLFIILFLGAAGLAIFGAMRQSRKAAANLQALAQRLGLEYNQGKSGAFMTAAAVTGRHEGRQVSFHQFTTGSGKSQTTWRAVAVIPNSMGALTFNLHRQGMFSKVEKLFGAREATVGDAAFDAAWFLQTNDPDFLGAALVPEIRAKLTAALGAGGQSVSFRLEKGMVRYAEMGNFSSEPATLRLEQMLPVLHDLADIAEVAAGRPS
jgi:hypothetical protein